MLGVLRRWSRRGQHVWRPGEQASQLKLIGTCTVIVPSRVTTHREHDTRTKAPQTH
jgi:hypothetical protein